MRFFFDRHECGTLIEDGIGQDCADLAAAEQQAFAVARTVMAEEIRNGELCLSCQIDILDDRRRFVMRVPFRRAVVVTGL